MLHEQLWKVLSFTDEVSTTVNLERREHADVRLLITTHADNKHLFDGKATKKDAFAKIAEQFTNASGFLVKRRRGACKRMGLVTNGTLFSQTEIPRIPNRNFPKFFVNGKHPIFLFHGEIYYSIQNNRKKWWVTVVVFEKMTIFLFELSLADVDIFYGESLSRNLAFNCFLFMPEISNRMVYVNGKHSRFSFVHRTVSSRSSCLHFTLIVLLRFTRPDVHMTPGVTVFMWRVNTIFFCQLNMD